MREREVCALSGQPPGPHCGTVVTDLYLTNASPVTTCSFHRSTLLDAATGYRLPPDRVAGRSVVEKTYVNWPPRVAAWFKQNGYPLEELPPLLPETHKTPARGRAGDQFPAAGSHYYLRPGIPEEFQKIALKPLPAAKSGNFTGLSTASSGEQPPWGNPFLPAQTRQAPGGCEDDHGRSSRVELVISEF